MFEGLKNTIARLHSLVQRENGATAVEFAIVMPVMMVCFAALVEGSRIYWNYQSAVAGVRDATRYLARTTDIGICGGTVSANYEVLNGNDEATTARGIIERNIGDGATNLFPSAVELTLVTAHYGCPDYDLRTDPTPVARVQATLTIHLPFGELFSLLYGRTTPSVVTVVTDQSRIYGI